MSKESTVSTVINVVLQSNSKYYTPDFAKKIPKRLREQAINNGNIGNLVAAIDKLRFRAERDLAQLVNVPPDSKQSDKLINSPTNSLPESQENKRKEIRFFFNVAATILHW
jgi:hypothetical protein